MSGGVGGGLGFGAGGPGGGTRYLKDQDADARSAMMQQPVLCNGEATGWQCKNYWFQVVRMDTLNSDELKMGERFRRCMLEQPTQNADLIDLPVACNQYVSTGRLMDRLRGQARPYNPLDELYEPFSAEEVAYLRSEWARRKEAKENMANFSPKAVVAQFHADMALVRASNAVAPGAPAESVWPAKEAAPPANATPPVVAPDSDESVLPNPAPAGAKEEK